MGKESFRFIHASDLHLERAMQDLLDLPDHLRKGLVDAPWKAAEAMFEHAVMEQVDFIVLSGDVLNPIATGAMGPAFLLEQFETLAKNKIGVYWAGGQVDDPDRWPDAVSLPSNVHYFSKKQVECLVYRRNGSSLASILGKSSDGRESIRAAEYAHDPDDLFNIAVGFGTADLDALVSERVDYWALGGDHQRLVLQSETPHARFCGSPQGRSLVEPGSHGFYLVEVDTDRQVQVHSIDVDSFRYHEQTVDATDLQGRDLRSLLAKRINKLQTDAAGRHLLIHWKIPVDLEQASLVGPAALEELLQWMRREFGHGSPAAWTLDIEILPPEQLPQKWSEEDTILGDFLRTSAQHRKTGAKDLNLKPLVDAETPGASLWQASLLGGNAAEQAALLERASLLGVDLLRGHQVDLIANTRRFGGLPSSHA